MVNYCRVNGCYSKSDREKDKSFYRLPEIIKNQCDKTEKLSEERRRLWLASLQQDFTGKNPKNIRICSDHFISNKKADLFDRDNPDWVPSVNMGTVKKTAAPQQLSGRYERKKMRERKTDAARTLLIFSDQVPETDHDMDFTPLPEEDTHTGTSTQTEISASKLDATEKENIKLNSENVKLKEHLKNVSPYSMEAFSGKDEKVRYFTGLTCFAILMTVFQYVEPFIPTKLTMGKFECLTMTLCRLRLNLSVNFLSYQLHVSRATISRIFGDVIDVLFARMKPLVMWPDRDSLRKTMPVQFQKQFGKKCAVIIDCFEVFIERPSNLRARAETWSSYKHHNTIKFLIGITPQGVISFISKSWVVGRVTNT